MYLCVPYTLYLCLFVFLGHPSLVLWSLFIAVLPGCIRLTFTCWIHALGLVIHNSTWWRYTSLVYKWWIHGSPFSHLATTCSISCAPRVRLHAQSVFYRNHPAMTRDTSRLMMQIMRLKSRLALPPIPAIARSSTMYCTISRSWHEPNYMGMSSYTLRYKLSTRTL